MTDVQLGILLRSYLVRLEAEIVWLDGELGPAAERPMHSKFVPAEPAARPGIFEPGWDPSLIFATGSIQGEWVNRPGQAAMLDGLQAIIDELAAAVEHLLPDSPSPDSFPLPGLLSQVTTGHRP